jgi:predicted dehydrogenase
MHKDQRRLRIGLLGCGPIAQPAHLDAIRKARNADLHAICDVARDLTDRIAAASRSRSPT